MKPAWNQRTVGLLILALVAGVAAVLFFVTLKAPAHYQGRNAYEWAARLDWPPDPKSRAEAAAALRAMGADAVPLLQQRLVEPEPVFRQARRWLGANLPGNFGSLFTKNLDPVNHVSIRCAAALGLKELGTNAAPAVPELIRAMQSPDRQVMWYAATAIGETGGAAVLDLIRLLDEPDANVRHAAAYALGQIGPAALAATPALVARLSDTSAGVRDSSLFSLSRIGSVAGPAVLNMVLTTQGEERRRAVTALASVRPRRELSLPVLVSLAGDSDPTNRVAAIEAMRVLNLMHTNAMNVYFTGLADPNAAVRLAAAKALEPVAQKSASVAPTLASLKQFDPDAAVRAAASVVLEKIAALNTPPVMAR